MKKYISIMAALAMAFTLAACSTAASSSTSQAASSVASSTASSQVESTASSVASTPAASNNSTVIEGCEGVTGTTQNGAMNGFELAADDGNVYYFSTVDNTVFNVSNGFGDGLKVAVYFGGAELGGDNCKAIEIDEIADGDSPAKGNLTITKAAADDPDNAAIIMDGMGNVYTYTTNDIEVLNGTVSNAAMSSFTLTSEDGNTYDIATCDATEVTAQLDEGAQVSVGYVGDINGDYAVFAVSQ